MTDVNFNTSFSPLGAEPIGVDSREAGLSCE